MPWRTADHELEDRKNQLKVSRLLPLSEKTCYKSCDHRLVIFLLTSHMLLQLIAIVLSMYPWKPFFTFLMPSWILQIMGYELHRLNQDGSSTTRTVVFVNFKSFTAHL